MSLSPENQKPRSRSGLLVIVVGGLVAIGAALIFVSFQRVPVPQPGVQPGVAVPRPEVAARQPEVPTPQPNVSTPEPLPLGPESVIVPGAAMPAFPESKFDAADLNRPETPIPPEIREKLDAALYADDVPALITFMSHPQDEVRIRACEYAVDKTPTKSAVATLLKLLTDRNPAVRVAAVECLGTHGIGSEAAIQALGKSLKHDAALGMSYFAGRSLEKLAKVDSKSASAVAGVLIAALDEPKFESAASIVRAFHAVGNAAQPAVPILVKLQGQFLADDEIAGVLAQCGRFDLLPQYIADDSEMNIGERVAIAEGISRLRPCTPEAVGVLEKLFADPHEQVRRAIIRNIGKCEPRLPSVIALIERAQGDMDSDIRSEAVELLSQIAADSPDFIQKLLKQLSQIEEKNWNESMAITSAMRKTHEKGLRQILEFLSDSQTPDDIRRAATLAMVSRWDEKAFDESNRGRLKELLTNTERPLVVRASVAVCMGQGDISDPPIVPTLLEVLEHPDIEPEIFKEAIYAIPHDDPSFVPPLMKLVAQFEKPAPADASPNLVKNYDTSRSVVLSKVIGLEGVDGAKLLPHLMIAARNGNPNVKQSALYGLLTFGLNDPDTITVVLQLTKDESKDVRGQAVAMLGRLPLTTGVIISEMRSALKDPDYHVRSNATATLGMLGPKAIDALPDVIALLKEGQESTLGVPEALLKIAPGNVEMQRALMAALPQEHYGWQIIKDLRDCRQNARFAVPALREYFPKTDDPQRFDIMDIFSRLGEDAREAIPEIAAQLTNRDEAMRRRAAETLSRMRDHAAPHVPALTKLLQDDSTDVQKNAIAALRQIGYAAKPAIPALEACLAATQSDEVKQAATDALTHLKQDPGDYDPAIFFLLVDGGQLSDVATRFKGRESEGLSILAKFATGENEALREQGWYAFTTLAREPACQVLLRQQLDDKELQQQALAAILLRQLPTQADRPALAKALITWLNREQVAATVAQLLIRLGKDAAPSVAETLLSEGLPDEHRVTLLDALEAHPGFCVIFPQLRAALASENAHQKQLAAVALAQLNPREPKLLPSLLECFKSQQRELSLRAIRAIELLIDEEVDATSAIPTLMTLLADSLQTEPEKSAKDTELFLATARVLALIGARGEDLPKLQKFLHDCNERAVTMGTDENEEFQFEVVQMGSAVIHLMGALSPLSAEGLSEIKTFLQHGKTSASEDLTDECASGVQRIGVATIPILLEIAKNADLPVPPRKRAITLLSAFIEHDEVQAALSALVMDQDLEIRKRTALMLASRPQSLPLVLPVMSDWLRAMIKAGEEGDLDLARSCIEAINAGHSKSAEAIPILQEVVKGPKVPGWLRSSALRALLSIKPEDTEVRALYFECLKTFPDDALGLMPAEDVVLMGESAITELVRVAEKESGPYQIRAARLLGRLEGKAISAVPVLRKLAESNPDQPGLIAAIAVTRIDPSAKDLLPRVLSAFLNHGEDQVDARAALIRLGPNAAEALPQLLEMVNSPERPDDALQIIGALGPAAKPCVPMLLEKATQFEHNFYAVDALETLGPVAAEVGPDLLARMNRGNELYSYASILSRLGTPADEAVEILRKNLQDADRRTQTIQLLGEFGKAAAPAIDELIPFAKEGDRDQRTAALKALTNIAQRPDEICMVLADALADEDPQIAEAAAMGLANLRDGAAKALPKVMEALQNPRRRTRWSLLQVLIHLGPAANDAVPLLQTLTKHSDPEVRREVQISLEKIQAAEEKSDKP